MGTCSSCSDGFLSREGSLSLQDRVEMAEGFHGLGGYRGRLDKSM